MEKHGRPRHACSAREVGALAALASPQPPSQAKGVQAGLRQVRVRCGTNKRRFMERREGRWQSRNIRRNIALDCFAALAMTPESIVQDLLRGVLNKPSPQRRLGSISLFAMDSSFRWNDENRLVQSFTRYAATVAARQANATVETGTNVRNIRGFTSRSTPSQCGC